MLGMRGMTPGMKCTRAPSLRWGGAERAWRHPGGSASQQQQAAEGGTEDGKEGWGATGRSSFRFYDEHDDLTGHVGFKLQQEGDTRPIQNLL